jgi:hypothetical protein
MPRCYPPGAGEFQRGPRKAAALGRSGECLVGQAPRLDGTPRVGSPGPAEASHGGYRIAAWVYSFSMKSPFPGMDPYLEPHWLDVHSSLVIGSRDSLNEHLPDDLVASAEERVAVESESGGERLIGPNVKIFEPPADMSVAVESAAGRIEAPYRLLAQVEPMIERFIRIIEAGTERLVTVIEFVSPTNKRGDGLQAFRSKRAELLVSGVNFVEVDLGRSGGWCGLLRPHRCPPQAITPYRVTFRVPSDPGAVYLHPINLRDRLPAISIPLRQHDPQVRLDLQAILDRTYSSGRYHRRLDYSRLCDPPLEGDEASWADELLRREGRR